MKLYEIQNNQWVKLLENSGGPIGTPPFNKGDKIFFRHVDGMYSLCTTDDSEIPNYDNALHLVAWAEVEIVE